ncbi:fibronectin-binding protein A N-terminus-domain-containing protein [Podospora conica]|nr:fibronectin-binding protein A N-terminus-domain-containing protein [Schizothecium conicum]
MKQRFSSLDVRVIAHELSEALVSLRLANIYDLNSKILLLKFAKPNTKQQLLIESGFRCHLTDFARTTAPAPSNFVVRLRKFLKTRRLTSVAQIGTDRIIEFQFSDGAYRLYLEFFASGNIILTDASLNILTLLRNVPEGEGQEPQRVGLTYTLENRQNFGGVPDLTKERLRTALQTAVAQTATRKTKKKGADELRRGLATTITELPPVLVDHVFRLTSFNPATKPAEVLEDEALSDALFEALGRARAILAEITSAPTSKGYIIAKPNPHAPKEEDTTQGDKFKGLLYEDFQPFLPKQFEDDANIKVLSYDGYNKTVDEFFSSLEGQRLESKLQEREATAKKKLEAARRDQEKRIEGLQEVQYLHLRKAAAIEANLERVEEAMDAVNGLLEQGMDWDDVNRLVEREQMQHNAVAELIKLPMKLSQNTITLLLGEEEEEDEADEEMNFDYETDDEATNEPEPEKAKGSDKRLAVDINLKLTAWNNAREYYDQKRSAAGKQQKTEEHSVHALKSAEQKIAEDLKKGLKQEKPILQPIRRQMWFEKFTWFVSSDGYLVLGGRDAQQNEMLYRRHLKKGDVYVHADVHGASSVIIKNNPKTPDAPIPPSTLAQAGHLSVCCSTAWDSKAGMGAYWVNADQVSKAAPAGEFLPVGSFMVRGKRNLLPPALLMLGFGLLFRVSDESKSKHVKHRLYDTDEPAGTPATEPTQRDATPTQEAADSDTDDDNDDEDQGDLQQRANPLQSNPNSRAQEETPADKLADLSLTKDQKPTPEAEEPPAAESSSDSDSEDHDEAVSRADTTATASTSTANKKPLKRGQRSKAKKMATKYKDQDDDDRQLMESLLGVTAARQKAEAAAAAKAQREAEAAAAQERRRQAQERAKKQVAEHEEVRRRQMLEEGGAEAPLDDDEQGGDGSMAPLDGLVGTPLPGDEILEVVPVCAPWSAMGRIKYKAKLQPGGTKKGKAVREVVERWRLAAAKKGVVDEEARDPEKMWPREVELIKGMKVEEAFNCVPVGKVTVMMAGGGGGGGGGGSARGQKKGGRGGKGSKR